MGPTQVKSWRLNERHYGALQGLNKAQTAAKHGEEQVGTSLSAGRLFPLCRSAVLSLQDCVARCVPFWESHIAPALAAGRRVLVAAHGNSLRGLVKHLDAISDQVGALRWRKGL